MADCHEDVKKTLQYAGQHEGYGGMQIDFKILKKGQKEVIIHCGKQYRYVVDSGTNCIGMMSEDVIWIFIGHGWASGAGSSWMDQALNASELLIEVEAQSSTVR